ncbi:MAG: DUF2083 domain-containing protein [Rhodobacteraceae bacterium]|nr:DUF2083 domain-containing protein [Paracoccaceae bacterium]
MARSLVGTRIRERRRNRRMTQTALAAAAGISPSYLNLIEHNRRGIAGRTLQAIAAELDTDVAALSDDADFVLINRLTEAAKMDHSNSAEIERIEEFVGRYPGWARLLLQVSELSQQQREKLRALTDRMTHDPFLSETMHQILSNITAIRSTAGILDSMSDIPPALQQKFLANLRSESQRLSATAEAMVDFFDTPTEEAATSAANTPEAQEFWSARGYYLPKLEAGETTIENLLENTGSQAATNSQVLRQSLERYERIANTLPVDVFIQSAKDTNFDALKLSQTLKVPVGSILYRLAHLPPEPGFPLFGLLECDMSGAVLFRKEIPEFALPQYSSACPLWPIYRAFGRPYQALQSVLEMPTGGRLLTYAYAESAGPDRYDLPGLLRSTMVFTSDPQAFPATRSIQPPILAGVHCSVCPRKACAARRIDYILA